jgi:hypothetical protein
MKEDPMATQSPTTIHREPHQAFLPHRWNSLSREEQLQQIRELIGSPYWSFLPADIQEGFLDDLYRQF